MDNDELQSMLTGMHEELVELKQMLSSLAEPATEGSPSESSGDIDIQQLVKKLEGTDLNQLLSSVGGTGNGMELLSGLLGGKKGLLPLISAFAMGKGDHGEGKLFEALGQLGPEMNKTVKSLQSMWPIVQMMSKNMRRGTATPRSRATREAQHPEAAVAYPRLAQPEPRPLDMVPQQTQTWGAWPIHQWSGS